MRAGNLSSIDSAAARIDAAGDAAGVEIDAAPDRLDEATGLRVIALPGRRPAEIELAVVDQPGIIGEREGAGEGGRPGQRRRPAVVLDDAAAIGEEVDRAATADLVVRGADDRAANRDMHVGAVLRRRHGAELHRPGDVDGAAGAAIERIARACYRQLHALDGELGAERCLKWQASGDRDDDGD